MEIVGLLVEEHNNIKRVLVVARKLALNVLNEGTVDPPDCIKRC